MGRDKPMTIDATVNFRYIITVFAADDGRPGQAGSHVPASRNMAQRFWSRVDRSAGPDGCWPWTGRPHGGHAAPRGFWRPGGNQAGCDLESHFHWNGDAFTDGQIIDTVTPRHANSSVNDVAHRAEPIWNPDDHSQAWRAIWAYSAKRARRDQKTLYAQEARAKAVVCGERKAKPTRFVKIRAGDRVLDEASLARAQSLIGLKGYVTNLPATVMPAGEVIARYHDLWRVERSFRMSNNDLRARPMFHRTRDTMEAHLTIVITALAIAHNVQERSGLTIAKVIKQLRPLRSATIAINGATQTFPPAIPEPQRQILASLNVPGH
jgi:hypothetical protein